MEPNHALLGLVESLDRLLLAELENPLSRINSRLENAVNELVEKLEAFKAKNAEMPPSKYLKSTDEQAEGDFEVLGAELWKLLKRLDNYKAEESPVIKRLESIYKELFSIALPQLPDDIAVGILSLLPQVHLNERPQSHLRAAIATSRRFGRLSQLAAVKVIVDAKVELRRLGFMSARDAVQFAINHNLQVVNLNGFEDLTLADLNYLATSMPNLKELMFDNFRVKLLPAGLVKLAHLEISMDNVTGNGIEHCRQMRSVQTLVVKQGSNRWLALTDSFVQELIENPHLHSLSLPSLKGFSAKGLENLGKCKQLKSLELNAVAGFADSLSSPWDFLGKLENLESLALHNVRELGQALVQIQKLSKLKYFYIRGDGTSDKDSFEKFYLPPALLALRLLNVQGLKNAGVINFERCRQLRELEFDVAGDFEASASLPWDFLGKLERLQHLRLDNVGQLEIALDRIQQLSQLKSLYLSGSETAENQNFEGLNLPESLLTLTLFKSKESNGGDLLKRCEHLESLELDGTLELSWDLLDGLTHLQNLRLIGVKDLKQVFGRSQSFTRLNHLYIESKTEEVQKFEGFRFPASLQTIRLSNLVILENPDLKDMFDGKKLTGLTFNLVRNFTDEIFETISSLDALETLSFRICPGIEGKNLALLKNLRRLESLTLADLGDFCVEGIKAIGSLEGLKLLELSDLPFLETDLAEIRGLQKLEQLSLSGCRQLSRETLKNLSECPVLETLNLEGCDQFLEEDLKNLLEYPNLKRIYLRNLPALTQSLEKALKIKGINVFR